MKINFFFEKTDYRTDNKHLLRKLVLRIIAEEQLHIDNLNIIFCNEDYLLDINREFLQREYHTDIISFYLKEQDKAEGELYISIDRIKENYKQYSKVLILNCLE